MAGSFRWLGIETEVHFLLTHPGWFYGGRGGPGVGVLMCSPGQSLAECVASAYANVGPAVPPPGPMILPPAETTGGVGSPPASVNIGCGCQKDAGTVTQPAPSAPTSPTPATPGKPAQETGRMLLDRLEGLPWWVYVLGALALSQFFNRGSARG